MHHNGRSLQISASQQNVGSNHAVSGLKFKILQRFLKLGYAVLLSDVDIIFIQNPFEHIFRDSDVEAMSDGWNNQTAYGAHCCQTDYQQPMEISMQGLITAISLICKWQ